MRFRPCIDIHAGQVKQIVGSTLQDKDTESIVTNFTSALNAETYAKSRPLLHILIGQNVSNLHFDS